MATPLTDKTLREFTDTELCPECLRKLKGSANVLAWKETALLGVSTETLVRRHRSQSAAP